MTASVGLQAGSKASNQSQLWCQVPGKLDLVCGQLQELLIHWGELSEATQVLIG